MWKEQQHSIKKSQPELTGKYRQEFALHKRPSYSLNYPIGNSFYSSKLRNRLSVGNKEALPLTKTSTERSWNQLDCSPVDDYAPFVDVRNKEIKQGSKDILVDQTELLLDEKTQKLLSRREKFTLNFYCNEYITKAMTIDAFVAVLLELFDQPSKYTLMTEIRGLVRREDLDKFDELIYQRELQALKSKVAQRFAGGENSPRRIHSSKKNSGVEFANNSFQFDGPKTTSQQKITRGISHHYSFIHQPRKSARALHRGMLRRHSSGGEGDDYTGYLDILASDDRRWSVGNVGNNLVAVPPAEPIERNELNVPLEPKTMTLEVPHSYVRRHRSLPDPHARSKQQEHSQQRSSSVRLPGHRIIQENDGTLRVVIKKTKPLLGIVIEGGSNTPQPLPRIISIHTSGAAFEAGGLKIGHIILEVDGMKMKRKRHSEVAKFIANAFYNSDKDQIEFLVTERTKTPLELRRSSFMVTE